MGRAEKEEEEEEERETRHVTRIFTYGTLKKGFSNHVLLENMMSSGDACYLGVYTTIKKMPLVCGPYRVPFLLDIPGSGERVTGELYSVSALALDRIDELEGTNKSHYERLPILLTPRDDHFNEDNNDDNEDDVVSDVGENNVLETPTEAYFADKSYAWELWKRNGEKGFEEYTSREAKGYIKRNERQPSHFTFLDHIRQFLSSSE